MQQTLLSPFAQISKVVVTNWGTEYNYDSEPFLIKGKVLKTFKGENMYGIWGIYKIEVTSYQDNMMMLGDRFGPEHDLNGKRISKYVTLFSNNPRLKDCVIGNRIEFMAPTKKLIVRRNNDFIDIEFKLQTNSNEVFYE